MDIFHQRLGWDCAVGDLVDEGGVRAVLQQTPHKVGEQVTEGADRRVDPDANVRAVREQGKEACAIELMSDSRYVIDAMTKNWLKGWKAKGWKTASNQPVKNQDLWLRLSAATGSHHLPPKINPAEGCLTGSLSAASHFPL